MGKTGSNPFIEHQGDEHEFLLLHEFVYNGHHKLVANCKCHELQNGLSKGFVIHMISKRNFGSSLHPCQQR